MIDAILRFPVESQSLDLLLLHHMAPFAGSSRGYVAWTGESQLDRPPLLDGDSTTLVWITSIPCAQTVRKLSSSAGVTD